MQICLNCGADVSAAERCANCGAYILAPMQGATSPGTHPQNNSSTMERNPAASPIVFAPHSDRLVRPTRNRLVAGVCAGIAGRYRRRLWFIRLLFVCATFIWLAGPILYVVLWAKLEVWPPLSAIPHIRLRDRSSELGKKMRLLKRLKLSTWLAFGGGITSLIAGILIQQDSPIELGLTAIFVAFVLFIAVQLGRVQVNAVAVFEQRRHQAELTARRICSQCSKSLQPGSKSCPGCGCDDLLIDAGCLGRWDVRILAG
jgi:phage shock protein PspC (stress-responsive transcriptional regulator)